MGKHTKANFGRRIPTAWHRAAWQYPKSVFIGAWSAEAIPEPRRLAGLWMTPISQFAGGVGAPPSGGGPYPEGLARIRVVRDHRPACGRFWTCSAPIAAPSRDRGPWRFSNRGGQAPWFTSPPGSWFSTWSGSPPQHGLGWLERGNVVSALLPLEDGTALPGTTSLWPSSRRDELGGAERPYLLRCNRLRFGPKHGAIDPHAVEDASHLIGDGDFRLFEASPLGNLQPPVPKG